MWSHCSAVGGRLQGPRSATHPRLYSPSLRLWRNWSTRKDEGLVRGNPGGGSSPLGRICAGNRGGLLKPSRVTVHLPLRQSPRELRARLDAELAKHLVKVVLDGACADEQPGCDLSVGLPLRREARDLRLLRGELVERVHGSFAGPLTGRQ